MPLAQLVFFIITKWVSSLVMLAHILWTSVSLATYVALLLFLSCTTFIAHMTIQTASYFVQTTTCGTRVAINSCSLGNHWV